MSIAVANTPCRSYVGPLGDTVSRMAQQQGRLEGVSRLPAGLRDRLRELVGNMPVQAYANNAGVSGTHLHNLLAGVGANPTYEMYRRLVSVRANRGYTVSWLATGRNEDEAPVETLDDFYAWKQKVMRQEKRYLEAILKTATPPGQPDLTLAQEQLAAETDAEAAAEEGRLDTSPPSGPDGHSATHRVREGTAA